MQPGKEQKGTFKPWGWIKDVLLQVLSWLLLPKVYWVISHLGNALQHIFTLGIHLYSPVSTGSGTASFQPCRAGGDSPWEPFPHIPHAGKGFHVKWRSRGEMQVGLHGLGAMLGRHEGRARSALTPSCSIRGCFGIANHSSVPVCTR